MTNQNNIKGYLIECDGRSLFIRDRDQIDWALEDERYSVTPLVPKPDTYEQFILPPALDQTEKVKMLEELYELQDKEIKLLKGQLTEFIEVVESIHEFSSKVTDNVLELKGLMKLIAETCGNLLRGRVE